MRKFKKNFLLAGVAAFAVAATNFSATALSLNEAVMIAVDSNPEIGQAIANREAVEFELRQALGLYLPRVSLEGSTGIRRLDNPSRRFAGIEDDALYPSQVGVVVTYDIWDGGYRKSEANRQAARVDGASFRVLERSEFIGLEIARQYFQVLLQQRVVRIARENVSFHEQTDRNVRDAAANRQLTAADRQQANERLGQARARLTEAEEALSSADIAFNALVAVPLTNASMPPRVTSGALPADLASAIGVARVNNPRIKMAAADVDAAAAVIEQSRSGQKPKLSFEGRATTGHDINGTEGATHDVEARLALTWSIFDGGIKKAEIQENIRRETETRLAGQQAYREVEEAVRVSWDRMHRQAQLARQYGDQLTASTQLVTSYREQFTVNQRSLLDVLDAQNTRFNVQVLSETAHFSQRYAEYRLLAATGGLLAYLSVEAPHQSEAYARSQLNSPSADSYQPRKRKPVNFKSPVDLTKFVN